LCMTCKDLAGRRHQARIFDDNDRLRESVASLQPHHAVELACIYDDQGSALARFARSERQQCPPQPALQEGMFENEEFYLTQEILLNEQRIGVIHIRSNLKELHRHLRKYVVTTLIV